ncbi:MAG: DNA translocase FtsK [Victivallales bacterium]|nr:DNA translocase FtsK [bacterium]MDY5696517.1 DNA translocase FtsK [Victivallales bacterium]
MSQEETETTAAEEKTQFRFRYVLVAILLLLFILSIASHNPADLAVLEGGSSEPVRNLIGPLGAKIARVLFYLFGLAIYPIAAFLMICLVRSFIPVPAKRKGYIAALAMAVIGMTLIMAMFPHDMNEWTAKLGLGHPGTPELALSGGVIGAQFAAPAFENVPAGLIRRHIGTVGTMIVSMTLLLTGIVLVFLADWKTILLNNLDFRIRLKKDRPEYDTEEDEEDSAYAPPPPQHPQPPAPAPVPEPELQPEPPRPQPAAQYVPPPPQYQQPYAQPYPPQYAPPPPQYQQSYAQPPQSVQKNGHVQVPPPAVSVPSEEDDGVPPFDVEPATDEKKSPPGTFSNFEGEPPEKPGYHPGNPLPPPRITNAMNGTAGASAATAHLARETAGLAPTPDYALPPITLFDMVKDNRSEDREHLNRTQERLQATLDSFGIAGRVSDIVIGPRITRFEVQLDPGVKVEKVSSITNNLAMEMQAESVRVLAPIPGRNAVGIEVPNKVSTVVYIRSLMEGDEWRKAKAGASNIPIILGRDVAGKAVIANLAKAPHLLIAGSTGSGKSVCMNTLIMSLLSKFSPYDLRLILVDPKFVELAMYRPIPHLITPVVNNAKQVPLALRWGVNEMERRYQILASVKAKNLEAFNNRPRKPEPDLDEHGNLIPDKLPLLVIIIDELADIMMSEAKSEVETSICRIAQKGRAAGIHLIIATQTPRKDIITGVIKANLPTKIAFRVTSGIDSRVILDTVGAERLLGNGDMLFLAPGGEGMERVQGTLVSDPEIQRVVDFVSAQVPQNFNGEVVAEPEIVEGEEDEGKAKKKKYRPQFDDEDDSVTAAPVSSGPPSEAFKTMAAKYLKPGDGELMQRALEIIVNEKKASTSYLQRRLSIGYNSAATLIDQLEERGVVSAPLPGGQKREILILDQLIETNRI